MNRFGSFGRVRGDTAPGRRRRRAGTRGLAVLSFLAASVVPVAVVSGAGEAVAAPGVPEPGTVEIFENAADERVVVAGDRLVSGADGNLWWNRGAGSSGLDTPAVGRVGPDGEIVEFTDAVMDDPRGLAVGADGDIWFIEAPGAYGGSASAGVSRVTTDGTITRFSSPFPGILSEPALGPDGRLWLEASVSQGAGEWTHSVVAVDTAGVFTQMSVPGWDVPDTLRFRVSDSPLTTSDHGDPDDTVVNRFESGPDGNVWFIDTMAQTVEVEPMPDGTPRSPRTVHTSRLVRMTPAGAATVFDAPDGLSPTKLTVGADGNLWFVGEDIDEGATDTPAPTGPNRLVRVTPTGGFTMFEPGGGERVAGVAVTADGRAWFTAGNPPRYGSEGVVPEYLVGHVSATGDVTTFPFEGPEQPLPHYLDPTITAPLLRSDGGVWFALEGSVMGAAGGDSSDGVVARMDADGTFHWGGSVGSMVDMTVMPDDSLWFLSWNPYTRWQGLSRVASDMSSSTVDARVHGRLTQHSDGNVWYPMHQPDPPYQGAYRTGVAFATPAGAVTRFEADDAPAPDFNDPSVPVVANGTAWFANPSVNQSGAWLLGISPDGERTRIGDETWTNLYDLRATPTGELWFQVYVRLGSGSTTAMIGHVSADGTVDLIGEDIPWSPRSLTVGPGGELFFYMGDYQQDGTIYRVDPDGTVSSWQDPAMFDLRQFAVGSDGSAWFVASGALGRVSPSGTVESFDVAGVEWSTALKPGPDGSVWFALSRDDSLGRVSADGVAEVFTHEWMDYPREVFVGPDGTAWAINDSTIRTEPYGPWVWGVARVTADGDTDVVILPEGDRVDRVLAPVDGALWGEDSGHTIRMTVDGDVRTFADHGLSQIRGARLADDGRIWMAGRVGNPAGARGAIGVLDPFAPAAQLGSVERLDHVDMATDFPGFAVDSASGTAWFANSQWPERFRHTVGRAVFGPGGGSSGPATGMLRVTTSPAVGAAIIVDGIHHDDWGLDWVDIAPGEHEVCFSDMPGFTTPPCETVEVDAGATTEHAGVFVPEGFLRVTVEPAGLPTTIIVDGVPRSDFGMWAWSEAGEHEVCFSPVRDWAVPECETVTVTAGETTGVTGTFTEQWGAPGPSGQTGTLSVTTDVDGNWGDDGYRRNTVLTSIVVDGVRRADWQLESLTLPVGDHELCFTDLHGYNTWYTDPYGESQYDFASAYITPDCRTVTIEAGQTTSWEQTFYRADRLVVDTDPAWIGGQVVIDGLVANRYGVARYELDWSASPDTVCATPVEGYFTPPCVRVHLYPESDHRWESYTLTYESAEPPGVGM